MLMEAMPIGKCEVHPDIDACPVHASSYTALWLSKLHVMNYGSNV